jgi:rRNA-processing protein FCF1
MKFDHRDLRAAPEETANVVLMVLLEARANHAVIDRPVIDRPVIDRLETAKGDLREGVNRIVVVNQDAAKDLRADHTVDRWDRRIQNALWKMRCVLMPTRMES